jgi:hypothetical protein
MFTGSRSLQHLGVFFSVGAGTGYLSFNKWGGHTAEFEIRFPFSHSCIVSQTLILSARLNLASDFEDPCQAVLSCMDSNKRMSVLYSKGLWSLVESSLQTAQTKADVMAI